MFEDGGSTFLDTLVITFHITRRRIQGSSNIRRHDLEKSKSFSSVSFPGGKAASNTDTKNCKKGKGVPLQAWSGTEGSRKLRFPDFMTRAQDGALRTGRLYPRKYSWYSFLLEAESTQGP